MARGNVVLRKDRETHVKIQKKELGVVSQPCCPCWWEEAGGSEVQSHPWLYIECEVNPGYMRCRDGNTVCEK